MTTRRYLDIPDLFASFSSIFWTLIILSNTHISSYNESKNGPNGTKTFYQFYLPRNKILFATE